MFFHALVKKKKKKGISCLSLICHLDGKMLEGLGTERLTTPKSWHGQKAPGH